MPRSPLFSRLPRDLQDRIDCMETIDLALGGPDEQVIESNKVAVRLPETPRRYYRHGWQSWSLAAWVDASVNLPISKPHLLHPMQHDPLYATQKGHHGSWVGAAETGQDEVVLLGSLGLEAHVSLEGNELRGSYGGGNGSWYIARGQEKAVFSQYAARLGEILGVPPKRAVPRVWCSWYGPYTAIDEKMLAHVVDSLGDLPFDVIQVDDGWQQAVGDWEANNKFPAGMKALAGMIRATGRKAGLWLAPLIAVQSSKLVRSHPNWFLHGTDGKLVSAGFNWGEPLCALDTTQPAVLEWLKALMQRVREWGFDYAKLDFLYGSALPGKRHVDMPREAAYRLGVQGLREGMGEDAYLLACGCPIIPSLGLCDAMRVGPDAAEEWESERDAVLLQNPAIPGVRNAVRTALNRLWLARLVRPDPDVVYFRSVECNLTAEQKRLLQSLALICGFKATSDLPRWLSEDERMQLREFLERDPPISQTGRWRYRVGNEEIDFEAAMQLPAPPTGWKALQAAVLGWLVDREWALRLNDHMGTRAHEERVSKLREQD